MQVYFLMLSACFLNISFINIYIFFFYTALYSTGGLFPRRCKIWRHLVVKTDSIERKMLKGRIGSISKKREVKIASAKRK